MADLDDAVRPTAWQWDVRARLAQLVGVLWLVGLGVAAIIGSGVLSAVFAGLMLAFFAGSVVLAIRVGRVAQREQELGYSTIFDYQGYELRDGKSLQVLRHREVAPEVPGRRSLLQGMIATLRKD